VGLFWGVGCGFLHPYALLKQRLIFGKECPKDEGLVFEVFRFRQ